jgi:hypothetical protein
MSSRYARHIAHHWRRHFPETCAAWTAAELSEAAMQAAEAARDEYRRVRHRATEREARVAAVDTWAVPPHTRGREIFTAVSTLLEHRWRRLWPAEYRHVELHDWSAVNALLATVQFIRQEAIPSARWHIVVADALEEHGRIPGSALPDI